MDRLPPTPLNLILWSPVSTSLPQKWMEMAERLTQGARGKPRPYIMEVRYDAQRVGDLLRSWGLPWDVVMAGYLWGYDREEIRRYQLSDTERVINHMLHATTYLGYIQNDILPPLLTPPFEDLGGLLVASAIYYEAFHALQIQSNDKKFHRPLSDIERIRRTLISITKRLGMWEFKRSVEDITEQLLNPSDFAKMSQEYELILKQDERVIEDMRCWLIDVYSTATGHPISVVCNACSIGGLKRRIQDARVAQQVEGKQLRGFDLITFEAIVPTVEECYAALGVLSQLGVIQQMNDQISDPKTNGFSRIILDLLLEQQGFFTRPLGWLENQSLLCKIQIATPVMQAVTRFGVLYPAYYKLYAEPISRETSADLALAQIWHSESGTIFPTLSRNITAKHRHVDNKLPIIVYDSKSRKPVALKKGATVLDFAYTLGQAIGAHTVYALVNNRIAPIHRILDADDIVEIITSAELQVKEVWLQPGYATSSAVRKQIRKSLHDRRGYKLLSQELERYHHILPPEVLEEHLRTLVKQHSLGTVQEYLERLDPAEELIYTPIWAAQEIMQRLADHNSDSMQFDNRTNWVPVIDTPLREDRRYFQQQRLCNICQPNYPHDRKIMGRIRKRDHILVVHKDSCPSLLEHAGRSGSPLFPMKWQCQPMFRVTFYLAAQDRKGLVLDLIKLLRLHDCDLLSLNAEAHTKYGEARIRFTIEAHFYTEVIDIWQALYKIDNVTKVDLDASATPLQVYDHLQQLREQKESIPQLSLSEFLEELPTPEARSAMLQNPFDISHPPTPKMFFGRSTEIEKMQRELCEAPLGRALILHGPRRSGKTSICANFLENHVQPPSWGVLFSLLSCVEDDEAIILERIADAISAQFRKQLHLPGLSWEDCREGDPQDHFRKFLENCLKQVPHSRLILILDEFGGAIESYTRGILSGRFFTFWKELMDTTAQLSLVFVLPTSSHNWLTSKKFSGVFSFAGTLPLEFLDTNSARQLLVDPLQEQGIQVLSTTGALAVRLTGGNPYYIALIGRELISYLNREINQQRIIDRDLRLITDQLIQPGTHQYFDYLCGELQSRIEMQLIQGMIEMTLSTKESKVQLKRLASQLKLSSSIARRHLDRLRDGLILNEIGSPSNPYYSFKVELIRKWLARNQWFFLNERCG